MTQRFGNWLKYGEMAQIHGARLKYLRNGFTMLDLDYEFDKRLKYVGNDVCMWEMAQVFAKRLKYVGYDVLSI